MKATRKTNNSITKTKHVDTSKKITKAVLCKEKLKRFPNEANKNEEVQRENNFSKEFRILNANNVSLKKIKNISSIINTKEKSFVKGEPIYQCQICSSTFHLKIDMIIHVCNNCYGSMSKHVPMRTIECKICNISYLGKECFVDHLPKHFKLISKSTEKYRCLFSVNCNSLELTKDEIYEHVLGHCLRPLKNFEYLRKESANFNCAQCKKYFHSYRNFNLHMKSGCYKSSKQYFCMICKKRFSNTLIFQKHFDSEHRRKSCEVCEKITRDIINVASDESDTGQLIIKLQEEFKIHLDKCSSDKRDVKFYTCGSCFKVFTDEEASKKHLNHSCVLSKIDRSTSVNPLLVNLREISNVKN